MVEKGEGKIIKTDLLPIGINLETSDGVIYIGVGQLERVTRMPLEFHLT